MNGPAVAPPPPRWLGLDALRGFTIAAMILVNNPGGPHAYAPLEHADWHGCTPTDLIFPTFLFVAGVAIVPAQAAARARGLADAALVPRILKRMAVLIGLGWFLSAFPFLTFRVPDGVPPAAGAWDRLLQILAPLLRVRFPGVLPRIGVCYAVAALLHLRARPSTQGAVLIGCLMLYWPLVELVPIPGHGLPDIGDHTTHWHLPGWLDRTVFGSHTWGGRLYDPEGLLSTIPAVATALFGVAAGRVLAGPEPLPEKVATLLRRGCLLAIAGTVWGWFFPLNKALWTSSFATYTAGVATIGLGLSVWLCEVRGYGRWALPLRIYGVNALLAFVGSGLLARVVGRLWTVTGADGKEISLQKWLFSALGGLEPTFASLLWALLQVLLWFLVALWCWRRGFVWKV